MTEPFSIGEALYDPFRVPEAVTSLLALMGVGIYAADGTAIRRGDEHDANDLWLAEDEVRGLIEMGVADAQTAYLDESGPYAFADLARALSPLLPGWSAAKLAGAYEGAYLDRPDDLVPTVMLGQPIELGTPLTRVQIWLLFVDGFLAPGIATAIVPGAAMAASGPSWGTANPSLPMIQSPDPTLTAGEWALLLAHLAVIGWTIPFDADPLVSDVHEGHDQPGPSITVSARVDLGGPLRFLTSPLTGRIIVGPRSTFGIRGSITWTSSGESILSDHGALSGTLGVPVAIGPTGAASIGYQVRQEPADRHGDVVSEGPDIVASIPVRDLVLAVYDVPVAAQGLLFGSRQATGRMRISWHTREGIRLRLLNDYDVDLTGAGIDLGFGGSAHGIGRDFANGVLEKQPDGTYRGVIGARSRGGFTGEFAGGHCDLVFDHQQLLYVVGVPVPSGTRQFSTNDLWLSFYPETEPNSRYPLHSDCPTIHNWLTGWEGDGPYNRPRGKYLAFGNSAWTNPLVGYGVPLPDADNPGWIYKVDNLSSGFGTSTWYVGTQLVGGGP
jgi:hypothetical protein